MFLKCIAFIIQAVLPAAMVGCIAYLTNRPWSEWRLVEYLIAAPLVGFAFVLATLMISKMAQWLHTLAMNRFSRGSKMQP